MDRMTTTDITQGLKIPFGRLREWIVKGYIEPTFPSPGQGQAAEFSLWDGYRIELFRSLVDAGFSRKAAAKFVNAQREEDKDEQFPVAYIMFRRDGDEIRSITIAEGAGWSVDLKSGSVGVGQLHVDPRQIRDPNFDPEKWDNIHLVNFKKIKTVVDKVFKE
jgi:hypothetical protein